LWQPEHAASFRFYPFLRHLDLLAALGVLCAVLVAGNLDRVAPGIGSFLSMRITLKNVGLLGLFCLGWYAVFSACSLYEHHRPALTAELKNLAKACTLGALPLLLFCLSSVSGSFRFPEIGLFWILSIGMLSGLRMALRLAGNVAGHCLARERRCLIVGCGAQAARLLSAALESPAPRYQVLGFVDEPGPFRLSPRVAGRVLGSLSDLSSILKDEVVDEVLIGLPLKSCYGRIQEAIRVCEEAGVQCKLPAESFSYSIAKPYVERDPLRSMITLKVVRDDHTLLFKRAIDVIGAITGLIVFAPLMLIIALAIRFTSKGPVLFSQKRFGWKKRVFQMYKFRTMAHNAEQMQPALESLNEMSGPVFKIQNDPRITPIGRFLRRTSLDELPQLWNVLEGSMSLVGPRPLPLRDVSRFGEAWLMRRFSVKPGLTCLWQISGRNKVSFERWMELDLAYIDQWSLGLDFEILAKTVGVVLRGEGAV
jgi:exopolysaccharide biosynthesis polyprenyl glycosylphosphotransferase